METVNDNSSQHRSGHLHIKVMDDQAELTFSGRLDHVFASAHWAEGMDAARRASSVVADMHGVSYLDGAGAAFVHTLRRQAEARGGLTLKGLSKRLSRVLEMHEAVDVPDHAGAKEGLVLRAGRCAKAFFTDLHMQVSFVGECTAAVVQALARPRSIRWKDVLYTCERVGADGLPIIALIGFLMGLIMSFQSAVTLERFGAAIFVPNMLGLAMFREMGPLVACILLAGRSGSAFAAEIGTMKVNEEVDALDTMGLSPVRFLVVPKILATLTMVPLLTIFFNFISLVGGALVMLALGFPLSTFTQRVFMNVGYIDFAGGMVKALVFGILVAAVGCMRGLSTRSGAGAVGDSTTSAVVSGLVLIAVADGLFAVAFYYLGW